MFLFVQQLFLQGSSVGTWGPGPQNLPIANILPPPHIYLQLSQDEHNWPYLYREKKHTRKLFLGCFALA